jgi:hypothetical protein
MPIRPSTGSWTPTASDNPDHRKPASLGPNHPRAETKKAAAGARPDSDGFDAGDGLSSEEQEYNPTPIINEVRTRSKAGATCQIPIDGSSHRKRLGF